MDFNKTFHLWDKPNTSQYYKQKIEKNISNLELENKLNQFQNTIHLE